jgi:hypothetical protein
MVNLSRQTVKVIKLCICHVDISGIPYYYRELTQITVLMFLFHLISLKKSNELLGISLQSLGFFRKLHIIVYLSEKGTTCFTLSAISRATEQKKLINFLIYKNSTRSLLYDCYDLVAGMFKVSVHSKMKTSQNLLLILNKRSA